MPIQVPEGYHLAVYKWTLAGDLETMCCVLGGQCTSSSDPGQIALGHVSAASEAGSICTPGTMAAAYNFVGVTVHLMTAAGFSTAESTANIQGTSGISPMPSNCALLVDKRTALGGRRGRGRIFLPPFTVDESNIGPRGEIVANYQNIQDVVDEWHDNLANPAQGQPSEWFLFHNNPVFLAPTPISDFVLQHTIATQRNRMR